MPTFLRIQQHILSLSLVLLLSFSGKDLFADEEVTGVRSLDFGACWIKEEEAGLWKIVSFNDGKVFQVGAPTLSEFETKLTTALKAQGLKEFGASRYRVDLHCSGGGYNLLFNLYEGEKPLCAWVRADSELTITQIAANPDPRSDQYCLGARPGLIFAGIKPQVVTAELPLLFQTQAYQEIFERVVVRAPLKLVDLYLKPKYQFQEQKIQKILQADATLSKYFDYIETDNYFTFSGETHKLREGQFMGYLPEQQPQPKNP